MAERFNAPVLKTGDLKGSGGSNPSSSDFSKDLFGVKSVALIPKRFFFSICFVVNKMRFYFC